MKTKLNLLTVGILLSLAGAGFGQPVIITQPQSCTNVAGTSATFWVAATGTPPLAHQWQKLGGAWSDLAGCTDTNLVFTNVQTSHAADYRVVITNVDGAATSDIASLTVIVPPGITRITNHNPFVGVGASVRLQVWVTGTSPFFQWCLDGTPLAGKIGSLLNLANVQTTNAGFYTVVVTNYAGSVTSSPVRLEVSEAPVIAYTATLQHKAVHVNTAASFSVTVFGVQPFSYQWRLDGQALAGKTNQTLSFSPVQPADEGDYIVVVTNVAGAVASEPARLWVVPPPSAFIRGDFTNGAFRYPYYYLMPTNYNPTRSYPLALHIPRRWDERGFVHQHRCESS